jgi:hypothetical protein
MSHSSMLPVTCEPTVPVQPALGRIHMQLGPWAKRITARQRIGFTLLELLVVVGMIADLNGQYSPSDEHLKRWNNDHEPHRDKWASVP